jgi:N-acetylglucosamine-6-sulfatase
MRPALTTLLLTLLFAAPATAAPNVVVIETDDQRADDMVAMPRTRALMGAEFANSFVSLSECCPSRATFLTGRYAHNHGVRASVPPFGGLRALDGSETLAVWLRRAGYETGLVGKYLNGYRGSIVPPGWTDFEGLLGRFTYRFYDYTVNANGTLESPPGYQTDDITERSLAFIRPRPEPFLLWVNYVAPHIGRPRDLADPRIGSTVPAVRHAGAFLGAPLPRSPSFNEADVSDKPPGIRRRMPFKQWRIRALAEIHRQRLASPLAVDEGVGRIGDALREAGELEDTLLIFTSDNGFMLGEHRVAKGKVLPYEPSIRVPLLMRGPGIAPGVREELVWNGDLAATILDAAGASAPFPLDGASLLRPLPDRAILLEGPPERGTNGMPLFTGIRTERWKYVEYVRGAAELYDLRDDPGELHNLARSARGVRERLARRLERLRVCAGAGCR